MTPDVLRPWQPSPGEWNRAAAAHLFRRAGFGAAPGEIEGALDAGLEPAIAGVFERERHDPELLEGVRALLPAEKIEPLQAWWMALLLAGGAPLRERMTLFWHDHFATSHDKVGDVRLMHRQNELFRSGGLGDFRALLRGVAADPAMLVWLDGDANRRGEPNENFARELFELFALGIGHYGEEDVREAARAFTGRGTQGRSFAFRAELHDPGEKRVLGRAGIRDGDDVIEVVLAHPACGRHVARRLLEEFVAPDPEPVWVEALAGSLRANDWDLGATLQRLLSSELFFSARARRSRIAAPVELVVVTARALGARVAPTTAVRMASEMGQALFRPPSVKGWDGGRAWINAGTWIARHNALERIAEAHLGASADLAVDLDLAFGAAADDAGLAGSILRALAPDLEDGELAGPLAAVARAAPDRERGFARATALLLTAPEYNLF